MSDGTRLETVDLPTSASRNSQLATSVRRGLTSKTTLSTAAIAGAAAAAITAVMRGSYDYRRQYDKIRS